MQTKPVLLPLSIAACTFLSLVPVQVARSQATPARLEEFVTASIGDAQILNPVLNADSASSSICHKLFEGLIDRDKDLNWRGRLATHWKTNEKAYFVVDPQAKRTPEQLARLIRAEIAKRKDDDTPLGRCLRNIQAVRIEPAQTLTHRVTEKVPDEFGAQRQVTVTVTVRRPPRIELTLREIDQDLFTSLGEVVGKTYFSAFDAAPHVRISPEDHAKHAAKHAKRFLPATEHNPVITFHLRKGVKFHDGHEFDSGDVKFTYDTIIDRKNRSPRVPDYEPVKSVEAPDKRTVRVVYKRLFSPGFATWSMGILPEHLLNERALRFEAALRRIPFKDFSMRHSRFNEMPIGCGPFRFGEWKHGRHIRLDRFEDYWEGAPEFKRRVLRCIPDGRKQREEFLAGALDSYVCRPDEVAELNKGDRFQRFSALSYGYTYIGYNVRREPFNDRRVRRALGMAIDVEAIIKQAAQGQGERITGPFIIQTDFYDKSIKPLPYDPKGALALLAAAGWKRNRNGWLEKGGKKLAFTLMTNTGNDVRKRIGELARESWRKIGADVETRLVEWSVFITRHVDRHDFDAVVLGWSMGIDPDLYQIWHSSQTGQFGLNFVGFKNAQADDLILRIRGEYDRTEQVRLCHRLHRIIADEQPYTFLYVGKWTALLNKRIVVVRRNKAGEVIGYEKIKQAKSGTYGFDFNKWTKLPKLPESLR